jgi:Uma2 family endonuclease
MIAQRIPEPFITQEEYLRLEDAAETKNEYFQGRIYPLFLTTPLHNMTGATPIHNCICTNTLVELGIKLEGKPCRPLTSDQRIRIESVDKNTYPDAVVVCGKPEFATLDQIAITNPVLIVEVLSPSTEKYDRTTKFDHYKTLPTFSDYLLIHTDQIRVEHYARNDQNIWTYDVATHLDDEFVVLNLDITLSVAHLYANLLQYAEEPLLSLLNTIQP